MLVPRLYRSCWGIFVTGATDRTQRQDALKILFQWCPIFALLINPLASTKCNHSIVNLSQNTEGRETLLQPVDLSIPSPKSVRDWCPHERGWGWGGSVRFLTPEVWRGMRW